LVCSRHDIAAFLSGAAEFLGGAAVFLEASANERRAALLRRDKIGDSERGFKAKPARALAHTDAAPPSPCKVTYFKREMHVLHHRPVRRRDFFAFFHRLYDSAGGAFAQNRLILRGFLESIGERAFASLWFLFTINMFH